jgi:oligopeptide/dipeptide ABC transporter ATP-binding protein
VRTPAPRAGSAVEAGQPVLSAIGLKKHYPVKEGAFQRVVGQVRAVDGVSFDVLQGETLGIVGESGCGKTTLGRCLTALLSPTEGGVYFEVPAVDRVGLDALLATPAAERTPAERIELASLDQRYRVDQLSGTARRNYRRNCQMVFQDAFASLNPRHLVRDIVGRPLSIYKEARGAEKTRRVVELLEAVGMGRQHLNRYPHEFSGGQQQRISIARALALDPQVIVLDEPTSALDVSVQAQILNLLHELQQEFRLTYVFVSHDLGVIQHISDRILVMYLGEIAEDGPTHEVFTSPRHPYTRALVDANPALVDTEARTMKGLAGAVPDPAKPPQGCRFHTRCPVVTPYCGWDFQDAAAWLTNHPDLLDAVKGVSARTPFEGDVTLVDDESAARAEELLRNKAPEAMRGGLLELARSGTSLALRFRERERVQLAEVAPVHRTSCILETELREPHTGAPHPVNA